jgi:hypothetical protein
MDDIDYLIQNTNYRKEVNNLFFRIIEKNRNTNARYDSTGMFFQDYMAYKCGCLPQDINLKIVGEPPKSQSLYLKIFHKTERDSGIPQPDPATLNKLITNQTKQNNGNSCQTIKRRSRPGDCRNL